MKDEEILKIIEIMALIASIIIVAVGTQGSIYMSAFSNLMQINFFEIQHQGNFTQNQTTQLNTQVSDLKQFEYNHQQMSVWLNLFGSILLSFSLICLLLYIYPRTRKYLPKIIFVFLLIFIIFFSWLWVAHTQFTF